jgi:mono/diheme cytochrome c family protein
MIMKDKSRRLRRWLFALAAVLSLAAVVAGAGWYKLFREVDVSFERVEDDFKYGSLGSEATQGLPYWVWYVLPRVFGEYLPGNGGYASLGFTWEQGHETPIGFSKKTIGFPRIAFNCALCHASTYRMDADEAPEIVPAGPAHQADTQAYLKFLFDCASDPRFNADTLLDAIGYNVDLSLTDRLLYRYVIIPQTKKALLEQRANASWMTESERPPWGPGRIDPFNPVKFGFLGIDVDETIGNADNMAIWDQKARAGQRLHWDGMNTNLHEVVLSSALGDGATQKDIELARLDRIEKWLIDLKAPRYPGSIDPGLVPRGKELFGAHCKGCHGQGGSRTGSVIPIDEIATDAERHHLWTSEAARRYNDYARGYDWKFENFRGTDAPDGGYVATPLTGLWLLGPYLHNGSVPSLADLLEPPYSPDELREVLPATTAVISDNPRRSNAREVRRVEAIVQRARTEGRRPPLFFRGYDVLDTDHVGFIADQGTVPDETPPFIHDTRRRSNGADGHLYGTTLPPADKRALLEFLKTL